MTGVSVKDVGALLNFTGSQKATTSARSSDAGGFEDAMNKASFSEENLSTGKASGEKPKTVDDSEFKKDTVNQSHPRKDALKTEETNPKAESEETGTTTQKLQEAASVMVEKVADELGISGEEVIDAMEELGFGIEAILDPGHLTELIMTLSGETDSLSLLTNETLYGNVQNLLKGLEEIRQGLSEELSLNPEELDGVLEEMQKVSIEENPMAKETVIQEMPEERVEQSKISITVEEGNRQVKLSTDEKGNTVQVQEVTAKAETDKDNSSFQEGKEQTGKREQSFDGSNPLLQTLQREQTQNVDAPFEQMTAPAMPSSQEIMDQILDYMKIQLKPEMDQLEMQLHPESLGTLKIHLVSKGGEVSAQFQVQNEAVKAVVESQMSVLRDALKEQGVKVEAVEVTVESHAFESNLWQGQERENGNPYQGNRKSPRRINLNALEEGFEENAGTEELLSAEMMRANGGTVDFTA